MLQKTHLVKAKKAIEAMYSGVCDVFEYQKIEKKSGATGFEEVKVLDGQPCRVSFKTVTAANESRSASAVAQEIKLFISNEVNVKAGSKIVVTQDGITQSYKNSGEPARYPTHQEIALELFKGWA